MLRNLSDYLSLFSLIFLSLYAIELMVLSFIDRDSDIYNDRNTRIELIRDYINNEEE